MLTVSELLLTVSELLLTVSELLTDCVPGTATPRPATAPVPRVKPEAEGIAGISQGTRIRPILHEQSTEGPTPRQARVKAEAQGIASVSRGKRMSTLIHEFAQHGPSPRQPRVKAEAEDTAEAAKVRLDWIDGSAWLQLPRPGNPGSRPKLRTLQRPPR